MLDLAPDVQRIVDDVKTLALWRAAANLMDMAAQSDRVVVCSAETNHQEHQALAMAQALRPRPWAAGCRGWAPDDRRHKPVVSSDTACNGQADSPSAVDIDMDMVLRDAFAEFVHQQLQEYVEQKRTKRRSSRRTARCKNRFGSYDVQLDDHTVDEKDSDSDSDSDQLHSLSGVELQALYTTFADSDSVAERHRDRVLQLFNVCADRGPSSGAELRGHCVRVCRMPTAVSAQTVRELFEQFGAIANVHVIRKTSFAHVKGTCLVTFMERQAADRAIDACNGRVQWHDDRLPQLMLDKRRLRTCSETSNTSNGSTGKEDQMSSYCYQLIHFRPRTGNGSSKAKGTKFRKCASNTVKGNAKVLNCDP